jgi:hypothetical protein
MPNFNALNGPFAYIANNIFVNLKISFIPHKEYGSKLNGMQNMPFGILVLHYKLEKRSY